MRYLLPLLVFAFGLLCASAAESPPATFQAVHGIFEKHCLDCHDSKEPEGNLVLDSFDTLMKGGETGGALVIGKSADSLIVKMIEGRFERDGKTLIMPPRKKKKLTADEIATIKSWIDSGAPAPDKSELAIKELVVPKIIPKVAPRNPVNALAYSPAQKVLAVARYGSIDLIAPDSRNKLRSLRGHRGNVNGVVFSSNGSRLFSVSGENGLLGEVKEWNAADGSLLRTWQGHKDTIYSVALSSDGKTLATGSYDQKIKLWDVATGTELKTLSGHNGAVFGLSFRPDGKILASASADSTVKLWDVNKGERRDTLAQSAKEVYAVAFSADGKKLFAGGVDNRIRVWQVSETAAETTNPILESRFAHEGAILRLCFSSDGRLLLSAADDRSIKLWNAVEMRERFVLEKQSDWCVGLAFVSADQRIVAGRLDGTVGFYQTSDGKIVSTGSPSPAIAKQESVSK